MIRIIVWHAKDNATGKANRAEGDAFIGSAEKSFPIPNDIRTYIMMKHLKQGTIDMVDEEQNME